MAQVAKKKSVVEVDVVDTLLDDWRVERPDLDVEAMAVVGRMLMISQKLQARAGSTLKAHDLKYSDFDVLATLRRSGEPFELTPTELMQSVLITSGAMTVLLDRLAARGLIKRGQDQDDRRVRTAILTSKGRALTDKAAETRFAEAVEAVACFSKREQVTVSNALRVMNQWLDQLEFDSTS